MVEHTEAGNYILKEFKISALMGEKERNVAATNKQDSKDSETKLLVYAWSINESMNSDCVHGDALIYDGVGLYYDFPLRGEEKLTITYVDFFGDERTEEYVITAITDLRPVKRGGSSDLLEYKIHFVSVGKFVSETRMVRKGFTDKVSNMVASVYDSCYINGPDGIGTKKNLDIEETTDEVNLVVPYYSGSETMSFFARNAYGEDNTSTYRFFETRDQYWFATIDYMIDLKEFESDITYPTFEWAIKQDDTPEGQYRKMQGLIDIDFGTSVNTMDDLNNGTYYKQVVEVDSNRKQSFTTDYRYHDNVPEYNTTLSTDGAEVGAVHTKEFADTFLNSGKRYVVMKDYPNSTQDNSMILRKNPHFDDMIMKSWATYQHHNTNQIMIKIYGRNTIFPGEMVTLLLDEFRINPSKADKKYSGDYIVESVLNEFVEDTYIQTLIISRGGIGL